jgi:ubiquinone/menaquinone biosynthesis C-methylase UbiE
MSESPAAYFAAVQASGGWDRVLASFAEFCRVEQGWQALDVGCGPGGLARHLHVRGCRVTGLDRDIQMVRMALTGTGERGGATQGDAGRLPYREQTFDLVTASNVLFLVDEPLVALTEMVRVAKRGGRVAMINPSERMSQEAAARLADERGLTGIERTSLLRWAQTAGQRRRFTEEETRRMCAEAGCRILEMASRIGPRLARMTLAQRVR